MSCLHRSPYLRVWSCLRWFNTRLPFVFGMLYLSSRQMNSTILTCCRIIRMHLMVLWVVLQGTLNLKTCQKLLWPIFVMNWAWDFLEIREIQSDVKLMGVRSISIQLNLYAFYCIIISSFFFSFLQMQDWDSQNASQIATELCGFVTILSGTFLLHKTKDMGNSKTIESPDFVSQSNRSSNSNTG